MPPPLPEPDYRFTLANERTFLAWLRTSLALLAAGVAVQQLGGSLRPVWARTGLSLLCVLLSGTAAVGGVLRWRAVEGAVRAGEPLPVLRLPWLLATGLVLLALVAAVLLLGDDRSGANLPDPAHLRPAATGCRPSARRWRGAGPRSPCWPSPPC